MTSYIKMNKVANDAIVTSQYRHSGVIVGISIVLLLSVLHSVYVTSQLYTMNKRIDETAVDCKQDEVKNTSLLRHRVRRFEGEAFIGAHVVGRRGSTIERTRPYQQSPANYFEWDSQQQDLSGLRLVDVIDDVRLDGTFLEIRASGYYYVYAQVTYYGKGLSPIGHETVKINNNQRLVLMGSQMYQRIGSARYGMGNRMANSDSGYHGGVFYLLAGSKLGVRPMATNAPYHQSYFMQPTKSYFGLFFIHS
ncbi:uncharacterized protein LOC100183532 [Ciona intestinalis]